MAEPKAEQLRELIATFDIEAKIVRRKKYYVVYILSLIHILIGTGGVSFFQVLPTCHNPSGQKAYIMNMYTEPGYRRRGIARRMVELLVAESVGRGVVRISLEATKMGRPLYAACGFVPLPDEMELAEERIGR